MADVKMPKNKTIRILVLGKDGSGKSTLINNMLTEELACENHDLSTTVTSGIGGMIEQHIKQMPGESAEVIMYDCTAVNSDLIREIQKLGGIELFDAVLFCCNALQRTDSLTDNLLSLLNDSFGRKLWDRTVFVITFVNMFLSLHSVKIHLADEAKEEAVKQLTSSLKESLKLKTSVGTSGCFSKAPVVLAGCDKTSCDLSLMSDWTTNVWKACLRQAKNSPRLHFLKVVRVQSIENDPFKSIPREVLVGAATGASVGTAISPGMGTVLISATGAVIGGVSAAYSNKKTRRAIRIVNSVTISENLCDQWPQSDQKVELEEKSSLESLRRLKAKEKMSPTVISQASVIVEGKCEITNSSIGSFAEELFEHFSIPSINN